MKNKILLLTLTTLLSFGLKAQSSYFGMNYRLNWTIGEFNDFIPDNSYRGLGISYKYFLNDNLAIGGTLNWTGFYNETERDSYQFDQGAVTAKQWNYAYYSDMQLTASYFLSTDMPIKPFITLGVGSTWAESAKVVGILEFSKNSWVFNMATEAGFLIHFAEPNFGINVSAHYNLVTQNTEFYKNPQYLGMNFGVYICPQWPKKYD